MYHEDVDYSKGLKERMKERMAKTCQTMMNSNNDDFWQDQSMTSSPFVPGTATPIPIGSGGTISVGGTSGGAWTFPPVTAEQEETDDKGAKIVRSKVPSIADVLVDIGKVIAKNGDIFEVREILQKYKIKLVDHDGEVVFDPAWRKDLKDKDF